MDRREEWNRARWASRRGLLELDLLLAPFVEQAFDGLDSALRQQYLSLLFEGDQDLLEWVMGRARVPDDDFLPIIRAIRAFHQLDT